MTAINPVASASAANAAAAAASPSSSGTPDLASTLNLSFSTYLKILTTQLQNQDPTNATDPNQFTQELIAMGGVQQQITTNQDLTSLINASSANSLATGTGYIGNYVASASTNDDFALQNGNSEFGFTLASAASKVNVAIQDSSGNTLATFAGSANAGPNYMSWNGLDNNGNQLPDGTYTFQVTAATAAGAAVAVSSPVAIAKVTGVQSNGDGTLELISGSLSVSTADVSAIYTPATLPNSIALTTQQQQPSS
jgi:flagellar basal-body rod modification protein FlgD